MLTFPLPADLNGRALADELRTAGIAVTDLDISVVGDELHIASDASRSAVETVVKAHVPPPPTADPDAELVAAITAATTLAQLKDALIGKGRPSAVVGRPTNR